MRVSSKWCLMWCLSSVLCGFLFFSYIEKNLLMYSDLHFFSFNVRANLNFLITAEWYCKPRSIHLFILLQTAPSMEFLQLFLKHSTSTYIPLHYNLTSTCALQEGRWYFVFAYLDFCTKICFALAINIYNRPVTLSILSPGLLCQHLTGTC